MFLFKVDTSGLQKMARDLEAARAKIPRALAQGLNQGGDKVRTQVQRALKEQTNVKLYKSITSRVRTVRAFPGRLCYEIVATGKGIPIREFPVQVTGRGVDAEPWGVEHLFKRSFREKYIGGLMSRIGKERKPIRLLRGPSLPKELVKGETPVVFDEAAQSFVPPALAKAIARAIG
jgi:hypothetical protein